MPIQLESLADLKDYVNDFPQIPVLYRRQDSIFEILAGKVCWEGESDDELEMWLQEKGAKRIKGWIDLETLFA